MKNAWVVLIGVVVASGCAHVKMDAPKDPIKLDVSMRLDIYQHIQSDIDQIEGAVKGGDAKQGKISDQQSLLDLLVSNAYAEGLGGEADAAVSRRQARHSALASLQQQGVVGENRSGMVEVRGSSGDGAAQSLVQDENRDRAIIYQAVAAKNGSEVETVQELYTKRLHADAPSGTPVEGPGGWATK